MDLFEILSLSSDHDRLFQEGRVESDIAFVPQFFLDVITLDFLGNLNQIVEKASSLARDETSEMLNRSNCL